MANPLSPQHFHSLKYRKADHEMGSKKVMTVQKKRKGITRRDVLGAGQVSRMCCGLLIDVCRPAVVWPHCHCAVQDAYSGTKSTLYFPLPMCTFSSVHLSFSHWQSVAAVYHKRCNRGAAVDQQKMCTNGSKRADSTSRSNSSMPPSLPDCIRSEPRLQWIHPHHETVRRYTAAIEQATDSFLRWTPL